MQKIELVNKAVGKVVRRNKAKLNFLSGSYGWEKWFQVELAHELSSQGDAIIEVPYKFDNRKKLPEKKVINKTSFIDIRFRKSNDLKDKYAAIEIKLVRTEQGLSQVLQDLVKVRALLGSKRDWNFRSVIVVFIQGPENIKNANYKNLKIEICKFCEVKPIKSDQFEFLVFGWEPNRNTTNKMASKDYEDWYKKIVVIFKQYGVWPKTTTKKKVATEKLDA